MGILCPIPSRNFDAYLMNNNNNAQSLYSWATMTTCKGKLLCLGENLCYSCRVSQFYTHLLKNIVTSWLIMDVIELKPSKFYRLSWKSSIDAEDECFNTEWFIEFTPVVPGWILSLVCSTFSKRCSSFWFCKMSIFMSVGYNWRYIKQPPMAVHRHDGRIRPSEISSHYGFTTLLQNEAF